MLLAFLVQKIPLLILKLTDSSKGNLNLYFNSDLVISSSSLVTNGVGSVGWCADVGGSACGYYAGYIIIVSSLFLGFWLQ